MMSRSSLTETPAGARVSASLRWATHKRPRQPLTDSMAARLATAPSPSMKRANASPAGAAAMAEMADAAATGEAAIAIAARATKLLELHPACLAARHRLQTRFA